MHIGFITDEISAEVEEAFALGRSWGIYDYELRMLGERRVPNIDALVVGKILTLQRQHGFRITALSPGVFKGEIHNEDLYERELREVLPATFRLASRFDTKRIIVFGFKRAAQDQREDEQRVFTYLRRAAIMAQERGLVLTVENEPGFWCDTGANTARLLAAIDSPHLRANWDAANAVGTGELPFPNGYAALKKWIRNVHVKDTNKGALIACVPIGEGEVDWEGQLRALARDKIVEHVTIETHCRPLVENSKKNLETVRRILLHTQRS